MGMAAELKSPWKPEEELKQRSVAANLGSLYSYVRCCISRQPILGGVALPAGGISVLTPKSSGYVKKGGMKDWN